MWELSDSFIILSPHYASSFATLIKKKIKFCSYMRKFGRERLQNHIWGNFDGSGYKIIYEEALPKTCIWGKYFVIFEEAVSHKWLCNCSNLNFLIDKENFLFYNSSVCMVHQPQQTFLIWKGTEFTMLLILLNAHIHKCIYRGQFSAVGNGAHRKDSQKIAIKCIMYSIFEYGFLECDYFIGSRVN